MKPQWHLEGLGNKSSFSQRITKRNSDWNPSNVKWFGKSGHCRDSNDKYTGPVAGTLDTVLYYFVVIMLF